jgi:uncharacterized protein with HEPN domain
VSDDGLYLIHILERIDRIEQYTASGCESFRQETMIQDAVLPDLHTLSESTQRVSNAVKDAHPEVDWRGIARFRNVVVHEYLGVDLSRIWDIVQNDLPDLKRAIALILLEVDRGAAQDAR